MAYYELKREYGDGRKITAESGPLIGREGFSREGRGCHVGWWDQEGEWGKKGDCSPRFAAQGDESDGDSTFCSAQKRLSDVLLEEESK
ncbi:hypothetical protein CCACVL1_21219 [Corchorus capsularis]|uniref:Uncharacterized protein n=1 Tax=Corchorus capsularis TaxID=210143 RepID=A0A1R3H7L7_COCAP|nr:hypothetical protein CCACVL1_21219 [Corchorus capsularis]